MYACSGMGCWPAMGVKVAAKWPIAANSSRATVTRETSTGPELAQQPGLNYILYYGVITIVLNVHVGKCAAVGATRFLLPWASHWPHFLTLRGPPQ